MATTEIHYHPRKVWDSFNGVHTWNVFGQGYSEIRDHHVCDDRLWNIGKREAFDVSAELNKCATETEQEAIFTRLFGELRAESGC